MMSNMNSRPPTPAADPRPRPTADHGSGIGAFLDQSGSLLGRTGEVGSRITDTVVRLAADELADRATAEKPTPGLVIRAGRSLFSRGRPATPARRRPEPTLSDELAPMPTWMRWLGVWISRLFEQLPLLAPLILSGWYTAHVGKDMLGLPWAAAILLSLSAEGGLWRLARLLEKNLVAGYSTLGLRVGVAAYLVVIGGMIFLHAITSTRGGATVGQVLTLQVDGVDWSRAWPAGAVSLLSAAGVYLWSKEARWQRRRELEDKGRVDKQLIRFSIWRYLFTPEEALPAIRYAVKHSIEEPETAIRRRREDREAAAKARADARRAKQSAKAARKSGKQPTPTTAADPDPVPAPTPTRGGRRSASTAPPTQPTATPAPADPEPTTPAVATPDPRPEPTRPTTPRAPTRRPGRKPTQPTRRPSLGSVDDAPVLTRLRSDYPGQVPSINEVVAVAKELSPAGTCSRSRAIRLRDLIRDERAVKTA